MNGLMMDCPLLISGILKRAAQLFPKAEIVSRREDGVVVRSNYRELHGRVVRLMNVLRELGVRPGDRVATFAWNHLPHLELYFAVPSLGAVLHTVNLRLHRDQLRFIFDHAEDRVIFADRQLAGILADLQGELPSVETYVLMDQGGAAPPALPEPWHDYETLVRSARAREEFPIFDENTAAGLCYTSGTTGDPKGVLYSHRSMFLHAMAGCMADGAAITEGDTVLPVVPMFHVNAWGTPYSCAMAGAKQVFPGSQVLDRPLAELLESERVTLTSGVPAVWNRLYLYLKQNRHDLSSLRTIFSGGSAAPRTLIEGFERDFGIPLVQGWGMTETSPVGTFFHLKPEHRNLPPDEQIRFRLKAGVPVICFEARIVDDAGNDLPWDGEHTGELLVRGPWVARRYYNNPAADVAFTSDGWFRTGDIASIDPDGYLQITDRKKDLIKRKGEWISSVDMENSVLECPGVADAAVVGRPDPECDEAPVVFVVRDEKAAKAVSPQDLIDFLGKSFARWQLPRPEDVRFIAALPRTGVGKVDKKLLRRQLSE